MGTTIKTIGVTGNIRTAEGAGTTTLTVADNPHQIFNLTASRTVVLPTTGVLAGDKYIMENLAAFDLIVQASGGQAITTANSANQDATIQKGYVRLIALANTPTLANQWRVEDVSEQVTYSTTFSGNNSAATSASQNVLCTRTNASVTLYVPQFTISGLSSDSLIRAGTAAATRMRPSKKQAAAAGITNSGATQSAHGSLIVQTDGLITIFLTPNQGTFTGVGGLTSNAADAWPVTYNLF